MAHSNRSIVTACARAAAVVLACCNLGAGPVTSSKVNHVIELFTSQGCSFCPRADQLLAAMAREPDVVAVSLPVDYWDFIGWRDTLASPAFTARQKAYAAAHGEGQVYTPQVIVNGVAGVAGGNREEIEQAIKDAKGLDGALTVPMRLSEAGGHYSVEVGENAGRVVTYTNVVRAIDKLGDWTGETATFDMPGTAPDGEGFVVLVQKGTPERPGAILAAAKTEGL